MESCATLDGIADGERTALSACGGGCLPQQASVGSREGAAGLAAAFSVALAVHLSLRCALSRAAYGAWQVGRLQAELSALAVAGGMATRDFRRSLLLYFCLFSIAGHWMEVGFCLLVKWGILLGTYDPASAVWRNLLNPFPIYGVGMVACALVLFPALTKIRRAVGGFGLALLLSFALNTLVCSGLELGLGLLQNQPDACGVYPLWDYTSMPFNFMGQICLQNSLAFGAVSSLMAWVVFPVLHMAYLRLPDHVKRICATVVVTLFLLAACLYAV